MIVPCLIFARTRREYVHFRVLPSQVLEEVGGPYLTYALTLLIVSVFPHVQGHALTTEEYRRDLQYLVLFRLGFSKKHNVVRIRLNS